MIFHYSPYSATDGGFHSPFPSRASVAMATDLEPNLAGEASGIAQNEGLYCWPWSGVVVNVQNEPNFANTRGYWMNKFSEYNPTEVKMIGHRTGQVVLCFGNDSNGFKNAMEFEKSFKDQGCGKKEWIERRAYYSPGSSIYGWLARGDDYKSKGRLGDYLRMKGKLKAKPDIVMETTKDRENLDKVHINYKENTLSVKREPEEECEVHHSFFEETTNASKRQRLDSQSKELNKHETSILQEKQKLGEEKTKNVLRSNQMAPEKQKATNEDAQRLIEELKRDKEEARTKNLELERKLEEEKKKNELTISNLQMTIEEQRKTNESIRRLAEEQRKTYESVLQLAEEHKMEKEEAFKKILELQRKYEDEKQKNHLRNSAHKTTALDHRKANENAAIRKRENEAKLKDILEEEKKRDEKQKLRLGIKELRRKLEGMTHETGQKLLEKIQELEANLSEIYVVEGEIGHLKWTLLRISSLESGGDGAFKQKLHNKHLELERDLDKKKNLVMEIEELKGLFKLMKG